MRVSLSIFVHTLMFFNVDIGQHTQFQSFVKRKSQTDEWKNAIFKTCSLGRVCVACVCVCVLKPKLACSTPKPQDLGNDYCL